jgi:hypothetical protein
MPLSAAVAVVGAFPRTCAAVGVALLAAAVVRPIAGVTLAPVAVGFAAIGLVGRAARGTPQGPQHEAAQGDVI